MEQINFSDYDRSLLVGVMESINRLADAMERESSDPILTCSQAAAYLRRHVSTISKMLSDGRLHKVIENGLTGIRKSELDKYK